jgi:malonyl-CoA/methylmalonyl-CoA synthetase
VSENLFLRFAARLPAVDTVFLETAEGQEVTFAEILSRAGRVAAVLRARGVRPGDRVSVQAEKSVAGIGLYLGVLQAGAVYVPLNPAYTPGEVAYFLRDAEPRVLVCDPAAEAALAPLAAGVGAALLTLGPGGEGTLAQVLDSVGPDAGVASRMGRDAAAILYTSGTTGRSKGAMLTHDNLWSNVAALHRAWGFRVGDVLIHALPLYHTHGLFVALNLMLLNGGRMIFLPRFGAEEVVGLLPRASVLMGVPTHYTRLLASPRLTREATAGKNEQPPEIRRQATPADVEAAIPEALNSGSFFFADIQHNQIDTVGLRLLRALAALGEGKIVKEQELSSFLEKADTTLLDATLIQVCQRQLLERVDDGYRFEVELIRCWFAR